MNDEFTTLKVHEAARQVITDCSEHAVAVHRIWSGYADMKVPDAEKWATEAVLSWSRQVSALFTNTFSDEQTVFKDGELCLFVRSSIVFGVIFHPAHYNVDAPLDGDRALHLHTKRMGRYCALHHDETDVPCASPIRGGECSVHGQVGDNVWLLPVPGTWSFHS